MPRICCKEVQVIQILKFHLILDNQNGVYRGCEDLRQHQKKTNVVVNVCVLPYMSYFRIFALTGTC